MKFIIVSLLFPLNTWAWGSPKPPIPRPPEPEVRSLPNNTAPKAFPSKEERRPMHILQSQPEVHLFDDKRPLREGL